ncbi:MAG: DUF3291 domain-containing protein, partial [Bacteroidota bacterium]
MHIAQINVARMKAPIDSAVMKEFRDFLAPMNALAESSPGFVWRYDADTETQLADTAAAFAEPDLLIVNMSVWESVELLKEFTYHTVHSYFVRKRARWFNGLGHPHVACWWVEPGTQPSVAEGQSRLALLGQHGVSATAFTLGEVIP